MPLVTELDLPQIDFFDPELRGPRYHKAMADLRARHWLAASPIATFVLDREAGEFFLRSKATTFPGQELASLYSIEPGTALREEVDRNILHINGADHRRLRNLVNPAFTPKAADRWRPAMREFLALLWEPLAGAGGCEFVEAFAKPYPSLTIARVMGAPLEDAARLGEWSNWVQRQFDGPSLMTERDRIEQSVVELYEYLTELLAGRRDTPGEDLISQLLAVEAEGDRLSDVECVNLVLNALIGGVDTTQSQLAQALRLFAGHPDQWELLAREPERAPAAVEEVLRFEPITPFTARICLEDIELRGVTFPKDSLVMIAAVTGNRDPDAFADPGSFDIAADRGKSRILTFGAGIHYCLGVNLARAELQEALAFLAPRMPGLELDGEPRFGSVHGIYGLDALPIRWGT
jgi:cytochrome P450